jgi:hypothetical protein
MNYSQANEKQNASCLETQVDLSSITNVLLIDNTVVQCEQFYNNCNKSTFPIIYNHKSNIGELFTMLTTNFKSIDRLSFVFDENICISDKNNKFINNKPFFTNRDLKETNINNMSENVKLIVKLCDELNIKNIDYLACNSLQYSNWNNYYNKISMLTNGVIVGASANKTGNKNYGGDWMLESTGVDVQSIYFTNGIVNYTSTLSNLSASSSINIKTMAGVINYQIDVGAWNPVSAWPIAIMSPVQVNIQSDLTLDNTMNYFICASDGITFDGNNFNITINDCDYPGLIQNGNSWGTEVYNAIEVINIIILAGDGSKLQSVSVPPNCNRIIQSLTPVIAGGWICQCFFGYGTNTSSVSNCVNNAPISSSSPRYTDYSQGAGGGILGDCSWANVYNCVNNGIFLVYGGGGIFGNYAFSGVMQADIGDGIVAYIKNCKNTQDSIVGGVFANNSCLNDPGNPNNVYSVYITNFTDYSPKIKFPSTTVNESTVNLYIDGIVYGVYEESALGSRLSTFSNIFNFGNYNGSDVANPQIIHLKNNYTESQLVIHLNAESRVLSYFILMPETVTLKSNMFLLNNISNFTTNVIIKTKNNKNKLINKVIPIFPHTLSTFVWNENNKSWSV